MGTAVSDMLNTTVHNIEYGHDDPKFQRQLCHESVSKEVLEEFRRSSQEMSSDYLQNLNQLLSKLISKNKNRKSKKGAGSHRIGFGIYYFDDVLPRTSEKQPKDDV